jgi:2-iminobutanoate/2-iminopropanoate deaminase
MTNTRVISTERAPKAIGPYSQAVAVPMGELLFCSGQIPLDPATGQLIAGGIDEQTTRVLDNIAGPRRSRMRLWRRRQDHDIPR